MAGFINLKSMALTSIAQALNPLKISIRRLMPQCIATPFPGFVGNDLIIMFNNRSLFLLFFSF